jgi:hypothetical protein
MLRISLIAATFLYFSSIAHAENYTEKWEGLSEKHYEMIKGEPGKSYEVELINSHNTFWKDVYKKCNRSAKKAKLKSFSAIAVVDASGLITEFLTMPDNRHFKCYRRAMVGKRYPRPPIAPFYELYEIGVKLDK